MAFCSAPGIRKKHSDAQSRGGAFRGDWEVCAMLRMLRINCAMRLHFGGQLWSKLQRQHSARRYMGRPELRGQWLAGVATRAATRLGLHEHAKILFPPGAPTAQR